MLVRITAEATINIEPNDILGSEYEDVAEYLPEGKDLNDTNDTERVEAMIYFDEDQGSLPMDELDWKIVSITPEAKEIGDAVFLSDVV